MRGVASFDGDKIVVFDYLIASEIWPFSERGLIRGGLLSYAPTFATNPVKEAYL